MERPVTSKSRGTCRYYQQPRGCFAGNSCKFLHAEPQETGTKLTPYDEAKTCRYYAQGFCKRGDKCWFKHALPKASTSKAATEEDEELCSICFDKPATYGLLMGCPHVFCITCIKEWRDSAKKNNQGAILKVTKLCPMCRAPSKYITPSSIFYKHGDPQKEQAISAYKESMAKVPCRYFQRTKADKTKKLFCPFGKDCFYQHLNDDGTPHIFADGVDVCMRMHPNRNGDAFASGFSFHPFNYRNPLEMIEVLMSDQFGTMAAELTGALENLHEHIDLETGQLEPNNPFTAFLRNPLSYPAEIREDIHDFREMPHLEPIAHSPPRSRGSSFSSDTSMPRLQDVSESDESGSDFSASDEEDDEDEIPGLERTSEDVPPLVGGGEDVRPPFVTDGRGRVIGARREGSEPDLDIPRTILGRMFNAFRR